MRSVVRKLVVALAHVGLPALFASAQGCSSTPDAVDSDETGRSSTSSALTTEDCLSGTVGGKDSICHRTSSATTPYTLISVATKACEDAHTGHVGDFLAGPSGCACVPHAASCAGVAVGCCNGELCDSFSSTCQPACVGPHATESRVRGTCVVQACDRGFGDCNGVAADGCETPLDSTTNCGACGIACAAGATCTAGACVSAAPAQLAASSQGVGNIQVAGGYVFYTEGWGPGMGSIKRVPVGGGAVEQLATGLGYLDAISVDATNVFFSGYYVGVSYIPLAGGATTSIYSQTDYDNNVVVDDTYAYWEEHGRRILRAPKAGGSAVTLYDSGVDGTTIFFALGGNNVYFGVPTAGLVASVPTSGGAIATIATSQNTNYLMAFDSDTLYWNNSGDGTIVSASIGGGAVTTRATGTCSPATFQTDATYVYWTDSCGPDGGGVYRLPKAGGNAVEIVANQPGASGLVVDTATLYWGSSSGVWKRAK